MLVWEIITTVNALLGRRFFLLSLQFRCHRLRCSTKLQKPGITEGRSCDKLAQVQECHGARHCISISDSKPDIPANPAKTLSTLHAQNPNVT